METLINRFFLKKVKQFKSYYVVWKPSSTDFSLKKLNSLNRTMQYENGRGRIFDICQDLWFKSYYVVWKPTK